jgi:hypothetical protein
MRLGLLHRFVRRAFAHPADGANSIAMRQQVEHPLPGRTQRQPLGEVVKLVEQCSETLRVLTQEGHQRDDGAPQVSLVAVPVDVLDATFE